RRVPRERELQGEVAHRFELRERRQLIEALESEVIEEFTCRAKKLRVAGDVTVAHDAHPVTLDHGADDIGIHRDSAHRLDFRARDWLAIGDQRQRLEQRARVTRGSLRPQARDLTCELGANLDPKAARRLLQLDPAPGILAGERLERGAYR